MSQPGSRGQSRGAGRQTPNSGHRGRDGPRRPTGDDRQPNQRARGQHPSGNARGPQWQTVGRRPRAANPEALMRRIHALEQINKDLLIQLGRINPGEGSSGSTSRGSTSGKATPEKPTPAPRKGPESRNPTPVHQASTATPRGENQASKTSKGRQRCRTLSNSHLPRVTTPNPFELLEEEFPHLSPGTLALAASVGSSGACTPIVKTKSGAPAGPSRRGRSPPSTQRASSLPALNAQHRAPRAGGQQPSRTSVTSSTPTQGTSSQRPGATAEPKVAPNQAGSDPAPQPRVRFRPGDFGWKGAAQHGVFHSPTVASPRYAGACLEASNKKGPLANDSNPVFILKPEVRTDVECGVGSTRANLARLLDLKEMSLDSLYQDSGLDPNSWKDLVSFTIDKAKALVVDEFMYYELVSRFPFTVRTADLARKMFNHLNILMKQFDTRMYTAKQLYRIKQATVRAALLPPAEELLTRKLIQQESKEMKKYNAFAEKGNAGSVFAPGAGIVAAATSLAQTRVGLSPDKK
uniref:Uncharacterized protein n=1 Tax=Riboviria sp. TaxID=2585031 RepID=A0A8B0RKR2_9VIRU|nr:hypothetical protein 1 [Riboviria sp.]